MFFSKKKNKKKHPYVYTLCLELGLVRAYRRAPETQMARQVVFSRIFSSADSEQRPAPQFGGAAEVKIGGNLVRIK